MLGTALRWQERSPVFPALDGACRTDCREWAASPQTGQMVQFSFWSRMLVLRFGLNYIRLLVLLSFYYQGKKWQGPPRKMIGRRRAYWHGTPRRQVERSSLNILWHSPTKGLAGLAPYLSASEYPQHSGFFQISTIIFTKDLSVSVEFRSTNRMDLVGVGDEDSNFGL